MSIDEIAGKVVEFVTSLCAAFESMAERASGLLLSLTKALPSEKKLRAAQRALKRSRRNSATVKRFKHGRNYRSRVPAKRGTKCDSIR